MRVAVIGSYARDTLMGDDGTSCVRDGGPARYITSALARYGVAHDVYSGPVPAQVRIVGGGEREASGVVVSCAPIAIPPRLAVDACIISTILDEFPLAQVRDIPGYHALDVQGYVRTLRRGAHRWHPPRTCWDAFACVKATERELALLSVEWIAAQRSRTLIVTHAARGATVWHQGIAHEVRAASVAVRDTIGAGDTFLAAFVAGTLRGLAAPMAGQFAAAMVHAMLLERIACATKRG